MHKMLIIASRFLAEQINVPPERITADMPFVELGADCLDVGEVIAALQDIYDIEFPETDLEYYPNLETLVAYLYNYMQEVLK